jgi:hypothetical protein
MTGWKKIWKRGLGYISRRFEVMAMDREGAGNGNLTDKLKIQL